MNKIFLTSFGSYCLYNSNAQQNPHYTQYMNIVNPAYAGSRKYLLSFIQKAMGKH
jgi:hypothetical protein